MQPPIHRLKYILHLSSISILIRFIWYSFTVNYLDSCVGADIILSDDSSFFCAARAVAFQLRIVPLISLIKLTLTSPRMISFSGILYLLAAFALRQHNRYIPVVEL